MAEEFAHGGQVNAVHHEMAGEGMTEVVESEVLDPGFSADLPVNSADGIGLQPRPRQANEHVSSGRCVLQPEQFCVEFSVHLASMPRRPVCPCYASHFSQ